MELFGQAKLKQFPLDILEEEMLESNCHCLLSLNGSLKYYDACTTNSIFLHSEKSLQSRLEVKLSVGLAATHLPENLASDESD